MTRDVSIRKTWYIKNIYIKNKNKSLHVLYIKRKVWQVNICILPHHPVTRYLLSVNKSINDSTAFQPVTRQSSLWSSGVLQLVLFVVCVVNGAWLRDYMQAGHVFLKRSNAKTYQVVVCSSCTWFQSFYWTTKYGKDWKRAKPLQNHKKNSTS